MRIAVIFLAFLAGLIALPVTAKPKACLAIAQRVGIEHLKADPGRYGGKCITVRGILVDGSVFADRQAMLDPSAIRTKRSIRAPIKSAAGRPILADVTGRVHDCAVDHDFVASEMAANPGDIIMVGGFCHTSMDVYLQRASFRMASTRPIVRLTEADVPSDARRLVEAPAGLPGLGDRVGWARMLLAAIATRDEGGFIALTNPDVRDVKDADRDAPPPWVRRAMRDARREFAKAMALQPVASTILARSSPQMRAFVEPDALASAKASGGHVDWVIACWCVEDGDCAGRWPIAPFLADNVPGRPYFCIKSSTYLLGLRREVVPYAKAPIGRAGFAEPPRAPR